jgi:hypothetical protein
MATWFACGGTTIGLSFETLIKVKIDLSPKVPKGQIQKQRKVLPPCMLAAVAVVTWPDLGVLQS